jgi:hypothetical protein
MIGIEVGCASCWRRVTSLALSVARWVHKSAMATFSEAPLSFRTAGFPRSGWKSWSFDSEPSHPQPRVKRWYPCAPTHTVCSPLRAISYVGLSRLRVRSRLPWHHQVPRVPLPDIGVTFYQGGRSRLLRGHDSSFIAPMDSCADPDRLFCFGLCLVAGVFECCYHPLLPAGPSRRYLCESFPWLPGPLSRRYLAISDGRPYRDRQSSRSSGTVLNVTIRLIFAPDSTEMENSSKPRNFAREHNVLEPMTCPRSLQCLNVFRLLGCVTFLCCGIASG